MNEDNKQFGQRVKNLRLAINKSRREVTDFNNKKFIDISERNLATIEQGNFSSIKTTTLISIAKFYDVTTDYLLLGKEEGKPEYTMEEAIKSLALLRSEMVLIPAKEILQNNTPNVKAVYISFDEELSSYESQVNIEIQKSCFLKSNGLYSYEMLSSFAKDYKEDKKPLFPSVKRFEYLQQIIESTKK